MFIQHTHALGNLGGIIRVVTVSQSTGIEGKCHLRRQSAEGNRNGVAGCGPGHGAMSIHHISQEQGLSVIRLRWSVVPSSHTPGRGQYQGWGFSCQCIRLLELHSKYNRLG